MRLVNKVAIVTAAAGAGIGQATARMLASAGANVVVSDAHAKRPFTVAEDIQRSSGVRTLAVQCDVTSRADVEKMLQQVLDVFGRIDILVNNAGVEVTKQLVDYTDEDWDRVINVCLKGTFLCSRAVLPIMVRQKSGKIVNIASVAGFVPTGDSVAYCAAKAGIMGFTRALAREVGKYAINVNAVAPGFTPNEYIRRVPPPPEMTEHCRRNTPLDMGRENTPEDIAKVVLFLASDQADFITGETISVSGGFYMH